MTPNALLILSTATLRRPGALRNHLCAVGGSGNPRVKTGALYIQFLEHPKPVIATPQASIGLLSHLTRNVYSAASSACPLMDVRFVLKPWTSVGCITTSKSISCVYIDPCLSSANNKHLEALISSNGSNHSNCMSVKYLQAESDVSEAEVTSEGDSLDDEYSRVVLGGTFDRIHNGHKILLTEAVLRCQQELTVGITDENMIKNKMLFEMIEPLEIRIRNVREFLEDIKTFRDSILSYRVVPISDPFGPTIIEPDLDLIIVSEETTRGATKINEIRSEKNFKPLKVHVIKLSAEPNKQSTHEEDKISSSSKRLRLLGERLRPPVKPPCLPYIIGLTGGIASGKSTICSFLTGTYGLPVINCDKLAHQAYEPGTECYNSLVRQFGSEVVLESGEGINRRALGAKVFGKPEELKKLTDIVWPEIRRLAQQQIAESAQQGHKAIIVDAAVLLEAKWDDFCHEVWVAFVPKQEAIKRIQERDGLSLGDAENRINSQLSNAERLSRATFAFCSLWEPEFTRSQVTKAWADAQNVMERVCSVNKR